MTEANNETNTQWIKEITVRFALKVQKREM
jgi:hypothetical protein